MAQRADNALSKYVSSNMTMTFSKYTSFFPIPSCIIEFQFWGTGPAWILLRVRLQWVFPNQHSSK